MTTGLPLKDRPYFPRIAVYGVKAWGSTKSNKLLGGICNGYIRLARMDITDDFVGGFRDMGIKA